jgi:hypothetical protein
MDVATAEREVSRFWQTSATFCSRLRGYSATRSISGKRNFSVAVRHTQPHAQQPQPLLCKINTPGTLDRFDRRYQPMWRRRMTQHSLVTTRLTMIFQHRGEARKPKSNCSMSLKGAKSSWWCCRSRGPILLRINALRN